jgi:hypothetical protein
VAALARSPVLAGVRRLLLNHNDVSDAGARALCESPHLGNLGPDGLMLYSNRISPEGLSVLHQRFGSRRFLTMTQYRPAGGGAAP